MTIEQAIKHAEDIATSAIGCECREEHKQLVAWLRELVERRKAPEIVRCCECRHFQCNMRFDGYVPKGADAYECRRGVRWMRSDGLLLLRRASGKENR